MLVVGERLLDVGCTKRFRVRVIHIGSIIHQGGSTWVKCFVCDRPHRTYGNHIQMLSTS